MAGPHDLDSSGGDTSPRRDRGSTTGPPRWVKISGIIAVVVVLLIVILLLTGGPGRHGPSRHASSGGLGRTPAFHVAEHGA
jgi:hypothetical protein